MQTKATVVAPSLRALLENFIDYAGIYPPAKLPLESALSSYGSYRDGEYSWMLRWFVLGAGDLDKVSSSFDGSLSVLGDVDETRAASIESTAILTARRPVYCEVSVKSLDDLDAVKKSGCFAKIRAGGIKPEAIPAPADVAAFIAGCAERRIPFKATAGLHHPIRAEHALTYETDAPRAVMHGFLNVLMAAALAWKGERRLEPIISEMDANSFVFDDRAHWRDLSLSVEDIRQARNEFIHSVGSCSFEEPIHDLQALGLL